eukprot:PhM_4_TR3088/c0_g3_i5/m.53707
MPGLDDVVSFEDGPLPSVKLLVARFCSHAAIDKGLKDEYAGDVREFYRRMRYSESRGRRSENRPTLIEDHDTASTESVLGKLERELGATENPPQTMNPRTALETWTQPNGIEVPPPVHVPTLAPTFAARAPVLQAPSYREETAAAARRSLRDTLHQVPRRIWDGLALPPTVTIPPEVLLVCERWVDYPMERVYTELRAFLLDFTPKAGLSKTVHGEIKTAIEKGSLAAMIEQVYQDAHGPSYNFAQTCRRTDGLLQVLVRKKVVGTQGAEAGRQYQAQVQTYAADVPAAVKAYHVAISGFRMPALTSAQGKTGNEVADE